MTPPLRLFLALPVPAPVREELARLQAELRQQLPGNEIRWTRPEQIHLTLNFLGNVAADQLESLTKAARQTCAQFTPMKLRAERLGFFPQIRSPRVIWAWVHDDFGELQRLQSALAKATAGFGNHKEEKTFTGHLTLARTQNLKPAQTRLLGELAVNLTDRVFGDWTAGHVTLMRSELSESGSHYSVLAKLPLSNLP